MDRNVEMRRNFLHWACALFFTFLTVTSAARSQLYAADQQDTEPPTSNATLLGNWNSYYFISSVEVSISAIDTPSGQAQDVKYTAYRVNSGTWNSYTEPFLIQHEGIYTISYFSEDYAGNPEQAKTTQFEINFNPPTLTPTPTQIIYATPTSGSIVNSSPTPSPIQGGSPSLIPTKSAASIQQAYPASLPYYRSPTKTPTPTSTRTGIKAVTSNKSIAPEKSSPSPTGQLIQEAVSTKNTEPQTILGQWTRVKNDKPESANPLFILILASVILCAYIFFVFYSYSKIKN